jgi:acylphosphatase
MNGPIPEGIEAFTALVSGRVQGVGFRYSARDKAIRLGLTGWVRNEYDGTVSVLAEGPRAKLDHFLEWLRRGPPGAWVSAVDFRRIEPHGTYRTFSIE